MTTRTTPPQPKPPADGERRAIRNLSAQYRVAAALAYEALQQGELEWVRLVDPDAGRLDDVMIARPGRLDAYQIKWSEYQNEVKFNELVTATTVSNKPYPAPFELMADGWRRLRAAHPMRRIHAHYLMHDSPSARDMKDGRIDGQPSHLQSFLRNAFPARAHWFDVNDPIYAAWSTKIDAIAAATGLPHDELTIFIADCELDLGFVLPHATTSQEVRRAEDVDALAHFFMQRVSSTSGPVELRPEDILHGLGWSDRFALRFKHEFPVDEQLYQPIQETVAALDKAVAQFRRGYLALVGPPGSGKSTTLTQTLRYREGIRLVRYYAFVRDDPRTGRGEAAAFLHDLCLSLSGLGVGRANRFSAIPDTLHAQRERLGTLLGELGEESRQSGVRTIILIDGLDHIEREQSPERSLIEELPSPAAIPDGVLIVLGTQPVGLGGPSPALRPIRAHLDEPSRTIAMDPLSRANVRHIVRTAIPNVVLSREDEDDVYRRCAGHPLSLAYLVKRLATAENSTAAAGLLNEMQDFGGDTDAEYAAYWEQLKHDGEVRELLGLISRVKGTIELSTIKMLALDSAVERFAGSAFYLFRQITSERWAFFHNSFRQFVIQRTEVDVFGRRDPAKAVRFHQRLAAIAGEPTSPPELRWECLYHLEHAGEKRVLLERAQQTWFREQYFAGRPLADIREDIHRSLGAAAGERDVVALAGLLLVHKELAERDEALESVALTDLQLRLADETIRGSLLMAGSELMVSDLVALQWSGRLSQEGSAAFAAKLFDAAEPVDVLAGVEGVTAAGDAVLDAWASVAWRFRPLGQVVEAIGHVRVDSSGPRLDSDPAPSTDEDSEEARFSLLVKVGAAIQDAANEETYSEFAAFLGTTELGREVLLRLDFRMARLHVDGLALFGNPLDAMAQVLSGIPATEASPLEAAYFADVLARLSPLDSHADVYLNEIVAPLAVTSFQHGEDEPFAPVEALFRQARALAARGRPMAMSEIPRGQRKGDFGCVLFQRLVVVVATLWGEAYADRKLAASAFVRQLEPLLAFRRRTYQEVNRWHDWYAIDRASSELYARALLAAEAHSRECFEETLGVFIQEWRRSTRSGEIIWSTTLRRKVILAAYGVDGDGYRTEALLEEMDGEIDASWELHERLEDLHASAIAWLTLRRIDKARVALDTMIKSSFGIYHRKDRQIQDWTRWVCRLITEQAEPTCVESAAAKLLRLIPLLYESGRGRGMSEATGDLLEAMARRWPVAALRIGEWLLAQGLAERATVLGALLGAELKSTDVPRAAEATIAAARLVLPFAGYEQHVHRGLEALLESAIAGDLKVQRALGVLRTIAEGRAQSGHLYLELLNGSKRESNTSEAESERDASPKLVQTNGAELSPQEVESLAGRPADFTSALAGAKASGRFDWQPTIKAVFGQSVSGAVRRAAQALLSMDLSNDELELFVRHAIATGERSLAEQATERVATRGKPYGWARFYDGGSRLSAARCFQLLDPEEGKDRALALFVDDFVSHRLSAADLVVDLDDLLLALTDRLPVVQLWEEIDEHISALVDLQESPFEPPEFRLAPSEVEPADTAVQLLWRDMDDAAIELAWEARRGLIDIAALNGNAESVRCRLQAALGGSFRHQTAALAMLNCMAVANSSLAAEFLSELEALAWSPLGVVRLAAQNVLGELGESLPTAPGPRILPAIYQLQLPPARRTETSLTGEPPPGAPLPDTKDPFDLTRMFHSALRVLSEATDFSFEVLTHRMAQLMPLVAPEETWSSEVEHKERQLRECLGIKLTYRRSRSTVAQHAFGCLLAELCDGGVIEWVPHFFERFLTCSDPIINLRTPTTRPAWVSVPAGEALGKYPIEEWFDSVAEVLPQLEPIPSGGCVVLAELTATVSQGRDREEEGHLTVVGHARLPFSTDQMPDISLLWHQERYAARDYPHLLSLDDRIPITVVAGGSIFANSQFIALNPLLGWELNWQPSSEGLFRWVNEEGHTMVESLYWAEGNVEVHDAGGIDQSASEGWLVLATAVAWQQMRPLLHSFVFHRLAGRQGGFSRHGHRTFKVAKDHISL
ncbi:ATP-binding protein [Pseudomonas aeruginosa]|nr:ATP-binding protein [Pseudomonas aeruginosa]